VAACARTAEKHQRYMANAFVCVVRVRGSHASSPHRHGVKERRDTQTARRGSYAIGVCLPSRQVSLTL
jgi:hypothetical protein